MSELQEEVLKETFDKIFKKYADLAEKYSKEYVPKSVTEDKISPPPYKLTPKSYGAKPLTIEEYKARQRPIRPVEKPVIQKKKHRAGKQVKINKEKAELRRLIQISSGKQKQQFFFKLRELDNK